MIQIPRAHFFIVDVAYVKNGNILQYGIVAQDVPEACQFAIAATDENPRNVKVMSVKYSFGVHNTYISTYRSMQRSQ